MEHHPLFVYGTLMSVFQNPMANYVRRYAIQVEKGYIHGKLYLVEDAFRYPIAVYLPNSTEKIWGELAYLSPSTPLNDFSMNLDAYEGSSYTREHVQVCVKGHYHTALAYVGKALEYRYPIISNGDFHQHISSL